MAHTLLEADSPAQRNGNEVSARYRRAQEQARALRGFYIHLGVYLVVNLGIFLLNWVLVLTNENQNWFFYWPLAIWGIAVVINGFIVLYADRMFGPEWEERKVREYLSKGK